MELNKLIKIILLQMFKCSLQETYGLEKVDKRVMKTIGKGSESDEEDRACRDSQSGANRG